MVNNIHPKTKPTKSVVKIKDLSASELPIKITILFPCSINMKLAMKQTNALANLLNIKMRNVLKLYK